MLAVLKHIFTDDKPMQSAITSGVSQAKQQNEAANARLKDALCKVLDGPNCECRSLKVVSDARHA